MLQDKLKGRLIKPLLLLAALLALSQSAWAADLSAYGLRGGWTNGWNSSTHFSADGQLTMTYNNYEFKLYNGGYIEYSNGSMSYDSSKMEPANGNLKLIDCPSGSEVVFTLTEVNGKPYLTASWGGDNPPGPEPEVDYTIYGLQSDKAGWDSPAVKFNASGTLTLTCGSDFTVFKLWDTSGKWYGAGDCYYDSAKMEASGGNFALIGCPSGTQVTFTLTMNNGKPALTASWGGGDLPVGDTYTQGSTIYLQLSDKWASATTNFRAEFINGSARQLVTFTHITGNYYYCTVPAGNWTSLDLKRYDSNGSTNWSNIFGITPVDGKNLIVVDPNATTNQEGVTYPAANSCTWSVYAGQEVISGMPFYPAGITNETDLKAEPAGKQYYYLVGHNINNGMPSPEWQLIETTPGTYTLDFTYNEHSDSFNGDDCPVDANTRNKLSLVAFTKDSAVPTAVDCDVTQISGLKAGWERAGVRVRAIYTEADGLKFTPLRYTLNADNTGAWVPADNFGEATYLPFVSLVGYEWKQQSLIDNGVTLANESVATKTTPAQWECAWVQHDKNGEPLLSRDGKNAYYNTQWPPLNNVFMATEFQKDGQNYDLLINSRGLTFAYTGLSKTGELWQQEYPGITFNDSYDVSADTKKNTTYVAYSVENLWANGKFKLWSGWSGARLNNENRDGEWCMNWNWGHEDQQIYTEAPKEIGDNQTVFLGNTQGDMIFTEPTYLRRMIFFMAVDENGSPIANDRSRSFLYFERAIGQARIQALSREDKTGGIFEPTVVASELEGYRITDIKLDLYRSSNDAHLSTLWNRPDVDVAPDDFTQYFGSRFEAATYANGYWRDGFTYESSGYYYYTMTLTFTDADGKKQTETVRSNAFYVSVAPASLFVAQLVKVAEGNQDPEYSQFDYVTYTPGAVYEFGWLNDEAYAEKMSNQGEGFDRWGLRVEKITQKPSLEEFYQNSDRAIWTEKVLVYARRPWMGETPDEGLLADGARGAYWELTAEGPKADKEAVAQKYTFFIGKNAAGEIAVANSKDDLMEYDGPLEYIFTGTDVFSHDFESVLHFYASDDATETQTSQPGTDQMVLRIPTPRMLPGVYTGNMDCTLHMDDPDVVTIAAEHHKGNVRENELEEHDYDNTRIRRLSFTAYLDMPNATSELISLIPDTDGVASEADKQNKVYGYSWRATNFAGDEHLLELLEGTRLNLKSQQDTHFTFTDQDLSMWLETDETGNFTPISRNLTFDFVRAQDDSGLIQFFPRRAKGVTFSLQSDFQAPVIYSDMVSAMTYLVNKGENEYYERLVLNCAPVSLDKDSKLSLPASRDNSEMQDISFEEFEASARYLFRINDALPTYNQGGLQEDKSAFHLAHYNELCTSSSTHLIEEAFVGPYWGGIADNSVVKKDFTLEVAYAYIFSVNRGVECEGAVENAPAPASAPRRAAAADDQHFIAFVGPSRTLVVASDNIQTGVETVTASGASIISGRGFIDLCGNEGGVYGIDGSVIYLGNGRVELPAGIYAVKTAEATSKVIVK